MKRLFSLLCMAVLVSAPIAADSYRESLKKLIIQDDMFDVNQYAQILTPTAAVLFPDNQEKGTAIIAEYAKNRMPEDLTDIYLPSFRKYVSAADLRQLTTLLSDSQFVKVKQHATSIVADMEKSNEYQFFVSKFQESLLTIAEGNTPEDIPSSISVSGDYAQAFNRYYTNSGTREMVMNTFNSVSGTLESSLVAEGVPATDARRIIRQIIQYADKNMPTILMSLFNKELTLRDLQYLNQMVSTEPYIHYTQASVEATSDMMQTGIALMDKMADWIEIHYPAYAPQVRKELNNMRKLLGK